MTGTRIGVQATLVTLNKAKAEIDRISKEQERLMCQLRLTCQKLESCRSVLEQLLLQNPEIMRIKMIEIS